MKTHRIEFTNIGNSSVLEYKEFIPKKLKENEVQIENHAIGVNFVDTYYRSGLYPIKLPSSLGNEAAGIVIAVGDNVKNFKVGERVAYCFGNLGAYAKVTNLPEDVVLKLPDSITFEEAASSLLKGLTVYYLFHNIYMPKQEEKILFHAASGGVGLIACQWARYLGAKLIGTVSNDKKVQLAKKYGAWEVINYKKDDFALKVAELTNDEKVKVVYDSVGKDTWKGSLASLSLRGHLISFGNASGPVSNINLSELASSGSITVTRPILYHYINTQEELQLAATSLFDLMEKKIISPPKPCLYNLKDAKKAHDQLLDRNRMESIVLIPD